jgi:ribonuclease HII
MTDQFRKKNLSSSSATSEEQVDFSCLSEWEHSLKEKATSLCGVDEVGRGPLAGPVVAVAAKVLFKNFNFEADSASAAPTVFRELREAGVKDSKKLSHLQRSRILNNLNIELPHKISPDQLKMFYQTPMGFDFMLSLALVSPEEIDEINIHQASLLAMKRALDELENFEEIHFKGKKITRLGPILVDGRFKVDKNCPHQRNIIGGDKLSSVIGLASIYAKEYRDHLMKFYHQHFPHYDFANNAGYPTSKHRMSLKKYGPCPIHRKTFNGAGLLLMEKS